MGKLTVEEAIDKLVATLIHMTEGRSLEDSLNYFDYLYDKYYDEDVKTYIKAKIIESKK